MYIINGYFPVARCVCGRSHLLKRATACACGATIRVRWPRHGGKVIPYGFAVDGYSLKAQPHKTIEVIEWQEIR